MVKDENIMNNAWGQVHKEVGLQGVCQFCEIFS